MFTATPKTRSGIGSARFSANGRGIWLTADAGEEFRQLRFFDLDTQRSRSLTADPLPPVVALPLPQQRQPPDCLRSTHAIHAAVSAISSAASSPTSCAWACRNWSRDR